MSEPLSLLIVEDSDDDAVLLVRGLERAGYEMSFQRVESRAAMQGALASGRFDLVITDHNMPSFSSFDALALCEEIVPDLPVIVVSGTIGEEHAVEAMRAGARDYVMKDNLARLVPAVRRELDAARTRRARREAERAIEHMAYHDALTNLVNRAAFEHRLERILHDTHEKRAQHALCYLDLDQFKVINDTCGHVAGDALLRELAQVLRGHVRQSDMLARLGGDEFGILMEHCALEQAERIAREICKGVESFQFVWQDKPFRIGISIGLVPIAGNGETAAMLLSAADTACYSAKDQGRNRVHVYREDDEQVVRRRSEMNWVSRINRALGEGAFSLFGQPIRPTGPGKADALRIELLVRLLDEDGMPVLPGAFLPAAERYGLSSKLDRWVLDAALGWLGSVPAVQQRLDFCSINLSAASLVDDEFSEFVQAALERSRLPARKICFEITETGVIANLGQAVRFMGSMKKMGCRFALDDFGSGMCSFAYLKTLPVDFLKIDGAFVRDIVDDPIDRAMVRSINDVGHVMGTKTIAEFVENEATLRQLRTLGVDYAQGLHLGAPRPVGDIERGGDRE